MDLEILGDGWRPLLDSAFEALEGNELLADPFVGLRLARYLDLIVQGNRETNLTGARSPEELVDLVVADAIVIARQQRAEQRTSNGPESSLDRPHESSIWLDVGSGMGAPGIPLALLLPEIQMSLIEPRKKRVTFLGDTLGALGLEHVRALPMKSQRLGARSADVVVSRATFPPPVWLVEGARLATRGIWVLLAKDEPGGLPGWTETCRVDYRWPLSGGTRRAVRFAPLSRGAIRGNS